MFTGVKRILLLISGFILLLFGAVGVILPVMPTTPFVLLAAICFSFSSPTIYNWLLGTHFFGDFIRNYKEKTGIPMKTKIFSICFLWVMLGIAVFFHFKVWLLILLLVIGACVTAHILLLKNVATGTVKS